MTDDILKQWEREALEGLEQIKFLNSPEDKFEPRFMKIADERVLALIALIRKKDEAIEEFLNWFQRMESDHWEKTSKGFDEACKNWDSLLQEPFDVTKMREALALTEQLK